MRRFLPADWLVALLFLLGWCWATTALSESLSVTAQIEVIHQDKKQNRPAPNSGEVVVWLRPAAGGLRSLAAPRTERYRLEQKDKQFTPHLLVVPVGSSVEFPNLDPFYHNVFSLFNGKRFDLGLYEAGTTRAVHFDHEGVSFIFCNIHPEMGAVVIALTTPYFAVSAPSGVVTIRDVPEGTYELNVWAEGAHPERLADLTRLVHLGPEVRDLGTIRVVEDTTPIDHKNKFGEDYFPTVRSY